MALVYKRSTKKAARSYARSDGMEPNPGVTHLAVVSNPGDPDEDLDEFEGLDLDEEDIEDNPFQWVQGRGQRHVHASPEYETLRGAKQWRKRHPRADARLYPVDERGTIVSRPVSKKALRRNSRRTSKMAYNIGALRRAMRSNPRGGSARSAAKTAASKPTRNRRRRKSVEESASGGGVRVRGRGRKRGGKRTSRKRRPTRRNSKAKVAAANRRRSRKGSKRTSRRKGTKRRRTRRNSKRAAANKKRSSRRRGSRRRTGTKKRRSQRRRPQRRNSKKRSSRRGGSKRRRSSARGGRRRSRRGSKRWFTYRTVPKKAEVLPTVARVGRSHYHQSGRPTILVYPVKPARGTTSKRRTTRTPKTKRRSVRRRTSKLAANRRRSRRSSRKSSKRRASRRGKRRTRRNPRYVTANRRRRSKRSSKGRRRSRRRQSARGRKRSSKGRRRSRRRMTPNMLGARKATYGGHGKYRMGNPKGRLYQLVEFGNNSRGRPNSKGRRKQMQGYPVMVPAHVSMKGYVRKFSLSGAARKAHIKRKTRTSRKERRRSQKRRPRKYTRRTSKMTRNPKYVAANRRRSRKGSRKRRGTKRRRVRRNQAAGVLGRTDWMGDVVTPILGGSAGFVGARLLSNGVAQIGGLRDALDSGKPAGEASNTKMLANGLGIVATLGLSTRVDMIRRNRGALITGMGLAFVDRLIGAVGGDAAGYLGEYVSQPLGEYVSQPLSGGVGEYVNQPLSGGDDTYYAAAGLGAGSGYAEGIDPADQAGVDRNMDVMEAAAGMGQDQTYYAAAGLGQEEDAGLQEMYERMQPPFESIQIPTDPMRPVSGKMPYTRNVPDQPVTPEGKGYAGGVFARHLFGGML